MADLIGYEKTENKRGVPPEGLDSYAKEEVIEMKEKDDIESTDSDEGQASDMVESSHELTDMEAVHDISDLYDLALDSMQSGVATYTEQFDGTELPAMATFEDILDQTVEQPFVDYAGDIRIDAPVSDLFAALNDIGEEYGVENMAYDAASDAIDHFVTDLEQEGIPTDGLDPLSADLAMSMDVVRETDMEDLFDNEDMFIDQDPFAGDSVVQQVNDFELSDAMGDMTVDAYLQMSEDAAANEALENFHTDMLAYIGREEILSDVSDDSSDAVSSEMDPPDTERDLSSDDLISYKTDIDMVSEDKNIYETERDIGISEQDADQFANDTDNFEYDSVDQINPGLEQEDESFDVMQDM